MSTIKGVLEKEIFDSISGDNGTLCQYLFHPYPGLTSVTQAGKLSSERRQAVGLTIACLLVSEISSKQRVERSNRSRDATTAISQQN
jgi:hypothetical protein